MLAFVMLDSQQRTIVLTDTGLKTLVQKPLSKVEGQILWFLAYMLPVLGEVVSKSALAAKLAVTDIHLNRAMKRLCQLGFLMQGPKVGLSYHYKLNPAFFRILS